MKALTPRGKALRWLTLHRGLTESPAGSNSDHRKDGIRKAQIDCANGGSWLISAPWCGVWCFNALQAAGVKGINSRMASVAAIEDDARRRHAPFGRGWTTDPKKVLRGDLVVLFGRGIHVETVRAIRWYHRLVRMIRTDAGNSAFDDRGSQSNGGCSTAKWRPLSAVHGFALVNYPNRKRRPR